MTEEQKKALEDAIWDYLYTKWRIGPSVSNVYMDNLVAEFREVAKGPIQKLRDLIADD